MTESKRIDYLDMAKGIGILLVIIGHISYVSEPVRQYISSFHMPLFFVISGILLCYKQEENSSLREFAGRKFKGLMMPYYFFSLCVLLIESARIIWKNANTWENVLRQAFQSLCLQGVSVLWFLPALFIGELLFVLIRKHCSHLQTGIVLVIVCVVTYFGSGATQEYFLQKSSIGAALCYDVISMALRNLFCVGLVGIGYYFAKAILCRKFGRIVESLFALGLLVLTGVVLIQNGAVDLRGMNLGNIVWFLAGGISGSAGVILMCRVLETLPVKGLRRFLIFMGCNSLLIMVTHLDFRVLYISICATGMLRDILFPYGWLICISIVLFVILIESVIIILVSFCRKIFQKNKKQNS